MSSRDKILGVVRGNQPVGTPLPSLDGFLGRAVLENRATMFATTLTGIGGKVVYVETFREIEGYVREGFGGRIVSLVSGLEGLTRWDSGIGSDPHGLEDVELAIVEAEFGVAENGAVWLGEKDMGVRALPFICQHLGVVLRKGEIF